VPPALQLTWTWPERHELIRFLIRDRDQKFTVGFDEVFRGVHSPASELHPNGELKLPLTDDVVACCPLSAAFDNV
jgi:hypothetical protein